MRLGPAVAHSRGLTQAYKFATCDSGGPAADRIRRLAEHAELTKQHLATSDKAVWWVVGKVVRFDRLVPAWLPALLRVDQGMFRAGSLAFQPVSSAGDC